MNILVLKWIQLKRIVKLIPIPYHLIIVVIAVIVGYLLFTLLSKDPTGYFTVGGFACILLAYHLRREDKTFVQSLHQKASLIFLLEYAAMSIPFFILIVLSDNLKLLFIFALSVTMVAFWPQPRRTNRRMKYYGNLFPYSYEWISGCRKSISYFLIVYLIAILLLFKSYLGVLAYSFILLQCCNFYREGEPISLLCLPEQKSMPYIVGKMKVALFYYNIFSLPYYILFLVLYPSLWWVIFILIGSASIALTYCICVKYAAYVPGEKNMGSGITLTLGILGAIIPIFLPLTLLLGMRYLLLAKSNLKNYLDAYDQ